MVEKYSTKKLIVLEYHGKDELSNSKSESRGNYYGIRGFPTAKFDGVKNQVGGWDDVQAAYENIIDDLLKPAVTFNLDLSGIIGQENALIKATITPVTTTTRSNLKLRWVIYEDNIEMKGKLHRFVVRDVLAEDNLLVQGTKAIEITKTIAINPVWKYTNLGVVAFIQDDSSKEVLQATVFKAGK